MPAPGDRYGEYTLIASLGKDGTEAYIWKAINVNSPADQVVAFRILKERYEHLIGDIQRHFEREVQIYERLKDCPRIISLLDHDWNNGEPYLVMPYILSGSLKDALARTPPPSPEDRLTYIKQTTEALSCLHKKGIIHRDVKPKNLLLDSNGILLCDLGIAIDADISPITRENWGSDPYCPPEQRNGKPEKASDQYALAVTMCQVVTGKLPAKGGEQALKKQSPRIYKVFKRASKKKPKKRYPSIGEFANALEQATQPEHQQLPPWTRLVIAVVCVLIVLAALSGSALFLAHRGAFSLSPTPTSIPANSPITLCLATDLPLHGSEGSAGQDILNGVQLAYEESPFYKKAYRGYQLTEFDMHDESSTTQEPDATQGVENLQSLTNNPSCPNPIGVIGPYDSFVAASEIPQAISEHLLLLSPSNTAPCLTQPAFSDPSSNCNYNLMHPQGSQNTYARLTSTDTDQGSLAADFLFDPKNPTNPRQGGLGARKIEIIGDEEAYGTQLAQAVINRLKNYYGIQPIGIYCVKLTNDYNTDPSCSLNPNTTAFPINNIANLADQIRNDQPDAIFFGGLGGRGEDQLRQALGSQIPYVVGSALIVDEANFFRTIGPGASNIYATFPGPDPSTFTSGTPAGNFLKAYQQRFGTSPGPYSENAFDAANIVLKVIKDQIDAGKRVTKESVFSAVLNHDFTGVAGNQIHFDTNGDNTGEHTYTIYQSQQQQDGTWHWSLLAQRTK